PAAEPTAAPTAAPAAEPTAAPTTAPAAEPTAEPAVQSPSVPATGLPEVNPLEVQGDILTAGSSTVFPLSEAIAEQFRDEGYAGNLTIDSIGSGAGFERFCKTGETDVANASRGIKDSERESCKAIGRDPIEFRVGTDALAVVVNPENDWLTDGVTMDELAAIFSAEATNWSDVNAAWPAEPIKRFTPGTDSGTFDFFVEAVMDPAFDKKGEEAFLSAGNLQLSEDDNVLVQGVAGDKYGIGFFGFAYFMENQGRLSAVAIDGVAPTADAVDAGAYKLARPLFIYSDAGVMAAKPQVAAFINYYLSNVNDVIARVGYFPAPAAALEGAAEAWQAAAK
ncbi:MAG: PstS family phosphate ABC transporter substrate-binding protein, partial [Planctomycetes bacterium]|nr:PstS family phosphate ABC transporter substrate-binding protein [Planctomycetota bacterium]